MKNSQHITIRSTGGKAMQVGDLLTSAVQAQMKDNSKYRKGQKPKWARFKATYRYTDGNKKPQFSYDWQPTFRDGYPVGKDNEEAGFHGLLLWALKCIDNGLLEEVKVFATRNPRKDTGIMDYDYMVFHWNHLMDLNNFYQRISEHLHFVEGKCNLERLANIGRRAA